MPAGDTDKGGGGAPLAEIEGKLSRDLSAFDITMIGVGAMIGAGIFVLTGIAAGTAGPALLLVFALNGLVTILTAMVYAELGSAIPEAGGGYLWVKEGLPGGNAFISGWMSWFAHAVAGSLYALGFGSYLALTLEELGWLALLPEPLHGELFSKAVGVLVALAFVGINFRGASETGMMGNIVTLAKVAILGLFIGSGLWRMILQPASWDKFTPFAPEGMGGIFAAMGLTYIAFEGYEIIVQAGEEVKDPRRNVPRAIFWSLAIVIPIYILVALVSLGAVETAAGEPTWVWMGNHAEVGIAEAARQFMPLGTLLLLVGGLASTMSALNATTFSSTRVSFAMGRDRYLPDFFARIHPRFRTPHLALAASGTLIIGMLVTLPIEDVAAAADIMFLLLFLQVNVAALTIRRRYGDKLAYGFLTPFFPVIPVLAICAQLFLAVFLFQFSPIAWYFAAAWVAVGYLLWRFYASGREREAVTTPLILEEREAAPSGREILVAVANPKTARGILDVAARLARERDATLALLYIVTVPGQIPRRAGRRFLREARPILEEIQELAEGCGVPFRILVRIAREPHQAIYDTGEETGAQVLVMGWKGSTRGPERILGRNIDVLLRRSNADTLVVREAAGEPSRILVVPDGRPATRLALRTALDLAVDREGGRVDLLYCRGHESIYGHARREDLERIVEEVREQMETEAGPHGADHVPLDLREAGVSEARPIAWPLRLLGGGLRERLRAIRDLREAVAEASEDYDRVLLPILEESWLHRHVLGGPERPLARASRAPVIFVRAGQPGIKFGVQQFFQFFRDKPS